ncbi:MAG: AraC family transcriptional regulator [Polycyclovorans sp.]|jgi:AraC-like DNA-binding protein
MTAAGAHRWTTPYSAIYPRLFLRLLAVPESRKSAMLLDTGLSWDELAQRDAMITYRQFLALVRNVIDAAEAPSLALQAGALTSISTHGPLGLAMLSASNLESALATMVQFICIRGPFIEASLQNEGEWTAVQIDIPEETREDYPHILEFVLLCIQSSIRSVSADVFRNGRLELSYAAPSYAAEYGRFFDLPVRFGQKRNRFVLASSALMPPVETANAEIFRVAVRECERVLMLHEHSPSTLARRIRAVLAQHRGEMPTLRQVAAQLAVSPRTLQRRCADEQLAFKDVQDAWHRELVATALERGARSLEQVAAEVGYADVSGLRRAVKRWRGFPQN